ncbi:MAG: hypothetical protein ACSLFE_08260 [Gemmatimonadaceae bacterium]
MTAAAKPTDVAERSEAAAATTPAPSQSTAVVPARPPLHPAAEQRRLESRIAAQISGQTWGKSLDQLTRVAFASYLIRHSLELDEVDVLGGRIYKNGTYYLNRAQPLVRAGTIELRHEYINHDPRLDELAKSTDKEISAKAKSEAERRMLLRIEHSAPEDQPAIVIAYVTIAKTGKVLAGVNWCGNGGKNTSGRLNDPVGDEEPAKTAITRAYRRVLRMAVGYEPEIAQFIEIDDAEDAGTVEEKISESRALIRKQREESGPLVQNTWPSGYDDEADAREAEELAKLKPTDAQVERLLDLAAHDLTPATVKEKIEAKLREKTMTRGEAMNYIVTLETATGAGEQQADLEL